MNVWQTRVCQGRQSTVHRESEDRYQVTYFENGVQVGEDVVGSLTKGRMLACRHTFTPRE